MPKRTRLVFSFAIITLAALVLLLETAPKGFAQKGGKRGGGFGGQDGNSGSPEGGGGKKKMDEKNQHTWKRFRMGKIRKDGQFDIVFESKDWIAPDPYPAALRRP